MKKLKVVILAGGFGTRLSEETDVKPKPMLEIGGKPILWHIMKIYSHYGFNDFIICIGYKGYVIKEYFANYFLHQNDVTFDFRSGNKKVFHQQKSEPWKVTLVDTGINSMTGGRIKRVKTFVDNSTFMLTYGDGVGDIDINALLHHHQKNRKLATVTAVQPSGRFGAISLSGGDIVDSFQEKPMGDGAWINGGFFVLEPEIFEYIQGDDTVWEQYPLESLARQKQLSAYKHKGFWKPMDTLRDKQSLEKLWDQDQAAWKIWHDK